jgi:ADP-ribose pyrophosphatase YjhB (NUDIX family)
MDLSSHGIVALVSDAESRFLLLEDARELMKGLWAPPHGRCETTDVSEEAGVIREVREETGLSVEPVRKVFTQPADTKVKTVSFWLVKTIGNSRVTLDEESSRSGWFTINEALKISLYPGTKTFFEKVLAGEVDIS